MASLGIDIGGTSVKTALIRAESVFTRRSVEYAHPSPAQLAEAIASALPQEAAQTDTVGLCVPGRLNADRSSVVQSLNIPAIQGVPLADLLFQALGRVVTPVVVSDAAAAAFDYFATHRPAGRLLAISIGTGVGAAVLDNGKPLYVSGETPGHFGQIDVSIEPSGTPRTLESYLGAANLRAELGADLDAAVSAMGPGAAPVRALARALRIAHAIYRPATVALLGYIGMRFVRCHAALEQEVRRGLTPVADPNWKLVYGSSPFHAALGAARLGAIKPEKQ